MKICSKCGIEKPLSDFNLEKKNKDGRRGYCKACEYGSHRTYYLKHKDKVHTQQRNWDRSHPDKVYNWYLRKHYGITIQEYTGLLEAQGGVCAICRLPNTARNPNTGKPKRLYVDHDHLTGAIRGLLCNQCNQAIGCFAEDPDRMVRAMEYLEQAVKQRKIVQLELFKDA